MKIYLQTLLLFFCSLVCFSVQADFQSGLDAAKRGDYMAALGAWQPLAEEGIACLLKDKFAVGVNEVILGGRASSVEILVFESDQERAKSIIAEILAE